jgi:hypothetical protein
MVHAVVIGTDPMAWLSRCHEPRLVENQGRSNHASASTTVMFRTAVGGSRRELSSADDSGASYLPEVVAIGGGTSLPPMRWFPVSVDAVLPAERGPGNGIVE